MYKSISVVLLGTLSISTFGALNAVAQQPFQGLKAESTESKESGLCTNACTDRGSGRREQRCNQVKPNADIPQMKRRGSGRIAPNPTVMKGVELEHSVAR